MLILFDIDGTLLLTQHVGAQCMHDASRELYGEAFTFDGVEIAGRIDPQIWRDVARANPGVHAGLCQLLAGGRARRRAGPHFCPLMPISARTDDKDSA